MLPTERIEYSPIAGRARLELPGGARLVVWTIVNVEEWDIHQAMPRTVLTPPAGGSPMPDIPNWAWHEYGNRVGFCRMLDVLDKLPKRLQTEGRRLLTAIPYAERREEAERQKRVFQAWCTKKGVPAVGHALDHDWDRLVAFLRVSEGALEALANVEPARVVVRGRPTPHGGGQAIQEGRERGGRHLEGVADRRADVPAARRA